MEPTTGSAATSGQTQDDVQALRDEVSRLRDALRHISGVLERNITSGLIHDIQNVAVPMKEDGET